MRAGELRHLVHVFRMTHQVAETGANPEELEPSPVYASIQPFAPGATSDDRAITHDVRMRYHEGVSVDTYLLFGTRQLFVRGIQDVDEKHAELRLLCEEVIP